VRTIKTARLRLVPVTSANATVLWQMLQEPDLRVYQDLPDVDRAQFVRVVEGRPRRLTAGTAGRFEWLLHYGDDSEGEPLGWISLRTSETNRRVAEIGYSVVRAHRNKGIASEAVAALIEEGFRRVQLLEIRAYCLPENVSSRAVLRRNGFEDEGTLTRGATVGGKPVDVIAYSMKRERWEAALTANSQATRS
jgi:[ribosomal protein S5]-alanine N-acetyltransferase